ncbi:hypothetical protein GCM10009668_41970 [Nocardioides dubius]|uniref:DUF6318 domain-containing protein n=1 Tax=Nocardioides dubius TaxID=317019 RepID=A0ABP4EPE6_9ACTN
MELPSGSESSEAAPSVGVPVPPSAMRSADEAGAEAFVRHYFALVNYAQATGDLEPLRAVSGAECSGCQAGVQWLEKVARKGWTIKGGSYGTRSETAVALSTAGRFRVSFTLSSPGQKVLGPAGEVLKRYEGGSAEAVMRVRVSAGVWTVLFWETL